MLPRRQPDVTIAVHHGDCLDVLATLPRESFDAVVTDPPYFLTSINKRFGKEDAAPAQFGNDGRYSRLSSGFMGAWWDSPASTQLGLTPFECWFAGFAAGEGCFRIQKHKEGKYYTCTFLIHLRADDSAILTALQRRLGGRLASDEGRTNTQGIVSAPSIRWLVESRESCWNVARILDKVPLFAKKSRDYAIWRRGLQVWTDTPKGNRWDGPRDTTELAVLHEAIKNIKRFDVSDLDLDLDPFWPPEQTFHYKWAKQAYRVLKPGGHMLVLGGTRTFHRLACGIEDAGFEVRDTLMFLYGSGFPKSHDVAKGIDPTRTADREKWNGWGTALKPSFEPILLCRKPLGEATIAANVLAHGTGALNIDSCRVPTEGEQFHVPQSDPANRRGVVGNEWQAPGDADKNQQAQRESTARTAQLGRWPANTLHDGSDEVLEAFAVYGETKSGAMKHTVAGYTGESVTGFLRGESGPGNQRADSGTAARFFYNASDAPRGKRPGGFGNVGAEKGDPTPNGPMYDDGGSAARFFYSAKASKVDRAGSLHPTVKPLSLCRYLCRLITPPGGTILDPFAGSGTTGQAAREEGFHATLIERHGPYVIDIMRRLNRAS